MGGLYVEIRARERAEGYVEGFAQGYVEGYMEDNEQACAEEVQGEMLRALQKKLPGLGMTLGRAMKLLNIPEEERAIYKKELETKPSVLVGVENRPNARPVPVALPCTRLSAWKAARMHGQCPPPWPACACRRGRGRKPNLRLPPWSGACPPAGERDGAAGRKRGKRGKYARFFEKYAAKEDFVHQNSIFPLDKTCKWAYPKRRKRQTNICPYFKEAAYEKRFIQVFVIGMRVCTADDNGAPGVRDAIREGRKSGHVLYVCLPAA